MYSYKENSNFPSSSRHKSPYSRPNTGNMDPTVGKILNRPRTSDNNYGRSQTPVRPFTEKNSVQNSNVLFTPNNDEPSTSYTPQNSNDYCNDVPFIGNYSLQNIRRRNQFETGHFRPRKSLLGNRTSRNAFDTSLETKMKFSVGSEVSDNAKTTKNTKNTQETSAKSFQIKFQQNLLHLFTGSVENLMHWSKLRNTLHILFEVTATIISIQPGSRKTEKCFWLSDSKSGPKLQVVFYEIDRPLPKLGINSLVTCIGRLITRNRLQAYKVEESSEETKSDLERLSFICNRVADEIVTATQKK